MALCSHRVDVAKTVCLSCETEKKSPYTPTGLDVSKLVGNDKKFILPEVSNFRPEEGIQVIVGGKTTCERHKALACVTCLAESLESKSLGKAYKKALEKLQVLEAELAKLNATFVPTECEKHWIKGCGICLGVSDIPGKTGLNGQIKAARKKIQGILYLFGLLRRREQYGLENVEHTLTLERLADELLRRAEAIDKEPCVDRTPLRIDYEDRNSWGATCQRGRQKDYEDEVIDSILEDTDTVNRDVVQEVIQENRENYGRYISHKMANRPKRIITGNGVAARNNANARYERIKADLTAELERKLQQAQGVRVIKRKK
jgi:hypothetical protein